MFAPLTPDHARALAAMVGAAHAILPGGDLEPYSHDETEKLRFPPEIVLKPSSTDEVCRIIRYARDHHIAVTPQAGRTSLSGGALPVHRGVALSMERMNRIVEIDRENLFAVVEPGVITQVLQEAVEKVGLYYPPDPSSRGTCTIGGNVAHNAGGPRAVKYGVTKDWIYGLEFVTGTGDVVRTGGKLLKNVTGYNLTSLLVGSEGTLGIVTQVTLKLTAKPKFVRTLLAPFPSLVSAASAVSKVFQAQIVPCALEYMEAAAVRIAEERKGLKFPHSEGAAAMLIIEVDGSNESQLEEDQMRISEVCLEAGAPDVYLASDAEKRAYVWSLRRCMGEVVKTISPYREEDTVVPRTRLPELVEAISEVSRASGIRSVSYGHIGDGNLHVNLLRDKLTDEEWHRRLDPAVRDLFKRTLAMGGQLTGEHGVGYVQRDYLSMAYPPHHIELLRGIKRVFDPGGILNPGKIFPEVPA